METKFTEGEWYVNTNMPGFSGTCISRFEPSTYWNDGHVNRIGDYPIATVHDGHNYWDEKYPTDANAKLIAAAPELLEACKWALNQFEILNEKGLYPEHLLLENGGNGVMHLVEAINKAIK